MQFSRNVNVKQRFSALLLNHYLFPTFFMSLLFLRCVVHNHSYHNSSHRTHSDKAVLPEAGGSGCRHYELGGVGYFVSQVVKEPVV